ncbi:MAG: hypothetical protein MPJ50_13850 [Pirellulales bacterium]|nr:hypothetical protein [Pirellulales bacterium]
MWQATLLTAALLILIGCYGYFASSPEKQSFTAFIPAGFGIVIGICGALASKEHLRKHAMHGAATIGLLGLIGGAVMGIRGLMKEPEAGAPEQSGIPFATQMQLWMAAVCLVFVALCVLSFIQARKAQQAGQSGD